MVVKRPCILPSLTVNKGRVIKLTVVCNALKKEYQLTPITVDCFMISVFTTVESSNKGKTGLRVIRASLSLSLLL